MLTGCSGSSSRNDSRLRRSPVGAIAREVTDDVDSGRGAATSENDDPAVFELSTAGGAHASDEELKKSYSEFIFNLMGHCVKTSRGKNVVISPDSVLFAMNLAAAGASGDTLDQMLGTMLPEVKNEDAFRFSVERMEKLNGDSVLIANSLWINEDQADFVFDDYKDYVTRHFDAEISLIPFDDDGVDEINEWGDDKTDGLIPELVDDLDESDLMSLINTITFDSDWKKPYNGCFAQKTFLFIDADGNRQKTLALSGPMKGYLKSSKASGFIKSYKDDRYAFITMLPDDPDTDIYTFMEEFTADDYWEFWNSLDEKQDVITRMHAFKTEYEVDLSEALKDMGMTLPFDEKAADFSHMTSSPAYISSVIHKTYIDVNQDGTKAGATTEIKLSSGCGKYEIPRVECDRPYAYAIVDRATGLPVFLGIVAYIA